MRNLPTKCQFHFSIWVASFWHQDHVHYSSFNAVTELGKLLLTYWRAQKHKMQDLSTENLFWPSIWNPIFQRKLLDCMFGRVVYAGQWLVLLNGPVICAPMNGWAQIYFKCSCNRDVSSIFQPRQHILAEGPKRWIRDLSWNRSHGFSQHRGGMGSVSIWSLAAAQSLSNINTAHFIRFYIYQCAFPP